MGSLEKELSVGLRIDFLHKIDCVFSAVCGQPALKMIVFISNPPSRLRRATSFAKGG